MNEPTTLKLCYVEPPWAYFTSAPLDEQWGDDWDDAPYQHNAGLPYPRGETIKRVAYDGPLYAPGEIPRTQYDGIGDGFSDGVAVEDMNRGDDRVPWLVETNYNDLHEEAGDEIYAGVSLSEFIERVEAVGGNVYLKTESDGSG